MANLLSTEAKETIIKKVLSSRQSMRQIALANNISNSTLHKWVQDFKRNNKIETIPKKSLDMTAEERFKHLQSTSGQEDVMVGAYCRKHGLYPHQLTQWEADFMSNASLSKKHSQACTVEVKALQAEVKNLKQIIIRKDKVLAETVALLVLKKKAAEIWGGQRGRLISVIERCKAVTLIKEASFAGARRRRSCEILGITVRTLERWEKEEGLHDKRHLVSRTPANKLTQEQRNTVLMTANSGAYQNLPPSKIVPMLADAGCYIASESTFYRILRAADQLAHRLTSRAATHKRPEAYAAYRANQVWSWDISYLPSQVRGIYFYLYFIMDIYSRKIVGWSIHENESAEYAALLLKQSCIDENVHPDQLVLHSDNGAPMKGLTMLMMLQELGVIPSFSRPSVSDDNPYSEALFKTAKYHHSFPWLNKFATIMNARAWGGLMKIIH